MENHGNPDDVQKDNQKDMQKDNQKDNQKNMQKDMAQMQEIQEYFTRRLPRLLAELPLHTSRKIGIYGLGVHTERLLKEYTNRVGSITADVIMVDSRRVSKTEQYHGYDVWNVRDIGGVGLDGIILSSSLYEEEMYRTIQELYPGKFPVYRFYEKQKEDIFIYKGVYWEEDSGRKPKLKIGFADMWPSFAIGDNDVARVLKKKYALELSREPDVLFCGQFGEEYRRYQCCKKVLWITEPFAYHLENYDYAFGFPFLQRENYLYYNSYAPRDRFIQYREALGDDALAKRRFCNFIYSQDSMGEGARLRKEFCMALGRYRHIDCPGKILNNMPADTIAPRYAKNQWESKLAFLGRYKFTIAFENSSIPGYTTEKLWQPFAAGSIPIYWGNPLVGQEVDSGAFINCNEYDNDFEAVIRRVQEIDQDDELYLWMLRQAPMKENYDFSAKKLEDFLDRVVGT